MFIWMAGCWMVALFLMTLTSRPSPEGKFDALLKQKLAAAGGGSPHQRIRIIGKCEIPLTERICQILRRSGVVIHGVSEYDFVASGTAEQIHQLAQLSLICRLHLSIVHTGDPSLSSEETN
ncbi:MAG: hypothetical protein D6681_17875 [Calditrichaeota bacterium]|nr:MAG: hypothetical protein D6681_17875 [Calditrichota bacterium]